MHPPNTLNPTATRSRYAPECPDQQGQQGVEEREGLWRSGVDDALLQGAREEREGEFDEEGGLEGGGGLLGGGAVVVCGGQAGERGVGGSVGRGQVVSRGRSQWGEMYCCLTHTGYLQESSSTHPYPHCTPTPTPALHPHPPIALHCICPYLLLLPLMWQPQPLPLPSPAPPPPGPAQHPQWRGRTCRCPPAAGACVAGGFRDCGGRGCNVRRTHVGFNAGLHSILHSPNRTHPPC
jgi:hypothetical protein